MRWTVHGERRIYESPWVSLALVDVEVPGGERFEHHVVRMPADAAGVVVHDQDRVLLIHRHFPSIGLIDQRFNVFLAGGAERVGEPEDFGESDRVDWVKVAELPELMRQGEICDGYSLTALLWFLQLGR